MPHVLTVVTMSARATTVTVASANPVKIQATLAAFRQVFPNESFVAHSVEVQSGVREQPIGDEETLAGAVRRAELAAVAAPRSDYWVGIEGGVVWIDDAMAAFAWIVVKSRSMMGKSRTGTFFVPQRVARRVLAGEELGLANDAVFGTTDSKRESGAIGLLTRDVVDRTALYHHAAILALVPFMNPTLFDSPAQLGVAGEPKQEQHRESRDRDAGVSGDG